MRIYRNLIAVLIVVLILGLMLLLGGCSTTKVNRGTEGSLDVTHTTFLIKTEAPSLEVDRDDLNDYSASFNAASRGGDIEAMAQIMQLMMQAMMPIPAGDEQ